MDVDGDGRVTYPELLRGLRAVTVKRVAAGHAHRRAQEQHEWDRALTDAKQSATAADSGVGDRKASAAAGRHAHDWVLEEMTLGNGVKCLVDRASGKVFHECAEGEWPAPCGRLGRDGTTVTPRSEDANSHGDLFEELDRFLKVGRSTCEYCSPLHPPHVKPSFVELSLTAHHVSDVGSSTCAAVRHGGAAPPA